MAGASSGPLVPGRIPTGIERSSFLSTVEGDRHEFKDIKELEMNDGFDYIFDTQAMAVNADPYAEHSQLRSTVSVGNLDKHPGGGY